jgi:eukaryotic-like serine/threonine-protein kinase
MTQTGLLSAGSTAAVCVAGMAKPHCRVRQWDLVEFAGLGSLAHIFRARPVGAPADRPATYAVKMLRPCWQNDEQAIRLLQREALVGQSISHPHLVPILAAPVVEPPRLVVMPWLEGASLASRLADGQQFGVPEALWIARQTAEALDALYLAGWIHGDVTPGNIHISPTGHVTLVDLNFARRHDEFGSAADRPIMGTCAYLAPEYLTSALRPDIRSDMYSLGAVLFQILSGRRPFSAETLVQLSLQHRQAAPPDLARLAPYVPRDVAQLVRQMMAKEPLRRPQTPRELIGRLVALEISTFSERAG